MTLITLLAHYENEYAAHHPDTANEEWYDTLRSLANTAEDDGWRRLNHHESLRGMAAIVTEFFPIAEMRSLRQLQAELASAARLYDRNLNERVPDVVPIEAETLVEQIVGVLQKPLTRQLLPKKDIEQLRKAILDPIEMGKVKIAENATLHCAQCGEEFSFREHITWTNEHGSASLWCSKCMPATITRCANAECHTELYFERPRTYCAIHAQTEEGGLVPVAIPPANIPRGATPGINRIFSRAEQVLQARPGPPRRR